MKKILTKNGKVLTFNGDVLEAECGEGSSIDGVYLDYGPYGQDTLMIDGEKLPQQKANFYNFNDGKIYFGSCSGEIDVNNSNLIVDVQSFASVTIPTPTTSSFNISAENLEPENIKAGVKILGKTGTYEETGSVLVKGGLLGTPVKNGEYVEEVWFNTDLSVEEVNAIGDSIDWSQADLYAIAVGNDVALALGKGDGTDSMKYCILDLYSYTCVFYSLSYPDPEAESFMGFPEGWNPVLNLSPIPIKTIQEIDEIDTSALISTIPFAKSEDITLEGEYDGTPVRVKAGNGTATSTPLVGTELSPGIFQIDLGDIYVNTSLSDDEIADIIKQLETLDGVVLYYENEGKYGVMLAAATETYNAIGFSYEDSMNEENNYWSFLYTNAPLEEQEALLGETLGFVGWNPDFDGKITINAEEVLVAKPELNLLSSTPFAVNSIDLSEYISNKKLPLKLEFEVSGGGATIPEWSGTPVPNTGYVGKVYFNTKLSVEEVTSIINTLTGFSTGGEESMWLCVIDSAAANGICIAHEMNIDGTSYYDVIGIIQNGNFSNTVWSSVVDGQVNLGWQEGFNGVVELNMENQLEVIAPQLGFTPENDKVSELLSTTPFTKKGIELSGEYDGTPISITENTTLDMKTLINEKKIPLSINISCTMPPTIKNLLDLTKSSKYMFNGMQELNINKYLSYSDTENVTDMSYMFNNCSKLNEVLMLDTSNAINTSGMFYNCTSLKNIPTFDTSKVTDMSYMFYKTALQEMPLLDTSNVTNMSNMLYDCNFTTMPLLNTSKVTDMSSMFKYCTNLTEVPLLDTSNATNMSDMFFNCTFTTIPLLNTSKVADMSRMFYFCSRLTEIPLLDTSSVTNMSEMFDSCYKLTTIPKFNTSKVTNMSSMFNMRFINIESPALTTIPLLNTSKVTDMSYMFNGCINLTEVPLLDTSNVTNMTYMFKDCTSLTTVPKFNTNCATSMYGMFKNCTNLTAIPKLNCDKAILKGPYTGLREICMGCSSLTTIDMYNMRAGFDLSDCTLLSQSELVKVFNNLATVQSTTILTLGSTLLAKLTEEDMAIAINKGWTLA